MCGGGGGGVKLLPCVCSLTLPYYFIIFVVNLDGISI